MSLVLWALLALGVTGAAVLIIGDRPSATPRVAATGAVVGGAVLIVAGVRALLWGPSSELEFSWSMPLGSGRAGPKATASSPLNRSR